MKNVAYIVAILLCWGCGNTLKNTEISEEFTSVPQEIARLPVIQDDTIEIVASGANMSEMKFDKKSIRVPYNKLVTIALVNKSTDATMPHNIVFIEKGKANDVGQRGYKHKDNAYVDPNDDSVIAHSPLAQINETVYTSFTTPTAGEYEFICSYPGHWGLMKGKFITE